MLLDTNYGFILYLVVILTCVSFQAIYKMTQAVTPDEVNTPDKMTDKLFSELDRDNDGTITWTEFYEGAKKNQVIINLLQCDPGT